jgi:hypothetical protein
MTSSASFVKRIFRFAAIIPVAIIALALFVTPAAHAWGCQGHEIVAMIAEMHLNPHALAEVNKLLTDFPRDPALNKYCKETGLSPMADAAPWADDYRSVHPETEGWHFIDIAGDATQKDIASYCPEKNGCLPKALQAQWDILRAPGSTSEQRAQALRFVIHFLGDIHQPLHDTGNNDQGGNCVPVEFFGTEPQLRNPQRESYSPNLHGTWDSGILGHMMGDKTVQQFAAEINSAQASQINGWMASGTNVDPWNWAWEGHEVALNVAYGKLPHPIPVEKAVEMTSCADDNHVSTRMLALHEDLEQPYQDATSPVVQQQIAKAAARLAGMLNDLWK